MKKHFIILAGGCVLAASTASAQSARAQANIARNNQANAMIQAAGNSLKEQISQGSDDSSDNDLARLQAAALAPPEPHAEPQSAIQTDNTRSVTIKHVRKPQAAKKSTSSSDKKASTDDKPNRKKRSVKPTT